MMVCLVIFCLFIMPFSAHAMKEQINVEQAGKLSCNTLLLRWASLYVPYRPLLKPGTRQFKESPWCDTIELPKTHVTLKNAKDDVVFQKDTDEFINDLQRDLPSDIQHIIFTQSIDPQTFEKLAALARRTYIQSYLTEKTFINKDNWEIGFDSPIFHPTKDAIFVRQLYWTEELQANYLIEEVNIATEETAKVCTFDVGPHYAVDTQLGLLIASPGDTRQQYFHFFDINKKKSYRFGVRSQVSYPMAQELQVTLFSVDTQRKRLYYRTQNSGSACIEYGFDKFGKLELKKLPDTLCDKFIKHATKNYVAQTHDVIFNKWYFIDGGQKSLLIWNVDDYSNVGVPFPEHLCAEGTIMKHDPTTKMLLVGSGEKLFFVDPYIQEEIEVPFSQTLQAYAGGKPLYPIYHLDVHAANGRIFAGCGQLGASKMCLLKPQLNYQAMQQDIQEIETQQLFKETLRAPDLMQLAWQ